jgi:signal transduction histidine kinase/CheY-like chemotaxis protein
MSTAHDAALERLRGLARLLAALADPPADEQFGPGVCRLACLHLGVDAGALWADGEKPAALGSWGLVGELPSGLPASLSSADIETLRAWGAAAGYGRVELALLTLDGRPDGLVALFSRESAAPLDRADLETLGVGVSLALAHRRATHELSSAVAELDRDQSEMVRAERMHALGAMARGIAHDFNNVLNAILGQAGVLQSLVGDRPAAVEALARLRKVALDGADTIRRVQEFSGARRDRDFDVVDLRPLLSRAADELRARATGGVGIELRLGAAPSVRGSVLELEELLRALVDNALEAMPDGGVLALELGTAGDDVTLVVADSGSGMSPSVQRLAFDPFFSTKGPRARGLGLALAHGIVRRHGGLIELDSRPGQGTRVHVRLPGGAAEAPVAEAVATGARGSASPTGRRVLLVEDDPDNREAMAALLGLGGFEVTSADCGVAGVRAFAGEHFDLVLTDLGLPDMDGWQVAREIKQNAPATPVALITGWGLNLDRDEIRRRGVDLLVKKPLDPHGFLGEIENLLQVGGRKPSA